MASLVGGGVGGAPFVTVVLRVFQVGGGGVGGCLDRYLITVQVVVSGVVWCGMGMGGKGVCIL